VGNGHRILTRTINKTIIRDGELVRVLNATEIQQWHNILDKIRRFEEKELKRKEKG